jgi:hypothetical protein
LKFHLKWFELGGGRKQNIEPDLCLPCRFESKRFCRDCRRNVLKEFKEMKELRRARRETRCNAWFCMADTTLAHYEVGFS